MVLSKCWIPVAEYSMECLKCKNPTRRWPRSKHRYHENARIAAVPPRNRIKPHCSLTSWRVAIAKTELLIFSTIVLPLYWDKSDCKIVLIFDRNWPTSKEKKKKILNSHLKDLLPQPTSWNIRCMVMCTRTKTAGKNLLPPRQQHPTLQRSFLWYFYCGNKSCLSTLSQKKWVMSNFIKYPKIVSTTSMYPVASIHS